MKYFDDVGMPMKEVSKTPHPTIDGVFDIEYQVGAKNYQGVYEPGQYTTSVYKKTVFDPKVISNDDIIKWGKEALSEAIPITTSGGQKYVKGTALNGLKFEGWIDEVTGEIKSFYHVFDWSN